MLDPQLHLQRHRVFCNPLQYVQPLLLVRVRALVASWHNSPPRVHMAKHSVQTGLGYLEETLRSIPRSINRFISRLPFLVSCVLRQTAVRGPEAHHRVGIPL